jgi:uncharacterized membrane protein YedE/YeeE
MSKNTKVLTAAGLFGVAFGFLISWGQFTDPDRIREMLLFEDLYLYLMMFTAMGIGFVGIRLVRRRRRTTLLTGEPIAWKTERPRANHIAGAAIFGLGWAIADSCPAPIAAQLAQGVLWAVPTIAGVLVGIELFFRRAEARTPLAQRPASSRAKARPTPFRVPRPRRTSLFSLPRSRARVGSSSDSQAS